VIRGAFTIDSSTAALMGNLNEHPIQLCVPISVVFLIRESVFNGSKTYLN
jgi:hypothetical protein